MSGYLVEACELGLFPFDLRLFYLHSYYGVFEDKIHRTPSIDQDSGDFTVEHVDRDNERVVMWLCCSGSLAFQKCDLDILLRPSRLFLFSGVIDEL